MDNTYFIRYGNTCIEFKSFFDRHHFLKVSQFIFEGKGKKINFNFGTSRIDDLMSFVECWNCFVFFIGAKDAVLILLHGKSFQLDVSEHDRSRFIEFFRG